MHNKPPGGVSAMSSMFKQLGIGSLLKIVKKRKDTGHYYDFDKYLPPGNEAPSFRLENNKGQLVSLDDFKGKYVVLEFGAYT